MIAKRKATLLVPVLVVSSLMLTAGCQMEHERHSSDSQIRKHIAGEWTVSDEWIDFEFAGMILAEDGSFSAIRADTTRGRGGTWEYRQGMLRVTYTRTSDGSNDISLASPNGFSLYPVVFADDHKLVMAPGISVAGRMRFTRTLAGKSVSGVVPWVGSEVYKLPKEGGFQSETLEMKDGRFRYWFSSDLILPRPPKYPIEGTYELNGDQLILSSGRTYTVRSVQGTRTLWRPNAVVYWERRQIIDTYGILMPVKDIKSQSPTLEPLFTKEEWDKSGEQVRQREEERSPTESEIRQRIIGTWLRDDVLGTGSRTITFGADGAVLTKSQGFEDVYTAWRVEGGYLVVTPKKDELPWNSNGYWVILRIDDHELVFLEGSSTAGPPRKYTR